MAHQADLAKWDPYAAWRYQKDLPADRTDFKPAWELLETYSKILADVIDAHVAVIRNKAYEVFHYPCLGRWRFFDLWITKAPEYPTLITRLTAGETLLDVGCCFAHVLRQLTADGVPSENLTGTDLQPDFIELGYELFRDKDTLSRGAWFEMPDHVSSALAHSMKRYASRTKHQISHILSSLSLDKKIDTIGYTIIGLAHTKLAL